MAKPKRKTRQKLEAPVGLPFDPKTTPAVYVEYAEKLGGVKPSYPITTKDALNLLTLAGYRTDRNRLMYHQQAGYFSPPEKQSGEYVWTRENVYDFCRSLESTRSWQSLHELHRHKMNRKEIEQGEHSLELQRDFMEDLKAKEPRELVSMLVTTGEEENRQLIAAILHASLGHLRHPRDVERN